LKEIVAIATLGCKVNQYESAIIQESFQKRGYPIASFSNYAQIYIINTCTVTKKADYQSRQLIRRAQKQNPQATIVVTGCYAQVAAEEIADIAGVHYIIGNSYKDKIIDLIQDLPDEKLPKILVDPIERKKKIEIPAVAGFSNQTRPLVKIQDGCDFSCSYCIIPSARGRSRSKRPETVFDEISRLARRKYKEVVLTGIHLGIYGLDLQPKTTLSALLKQLEKDKIIGRIRLSSIEPMEISEELIDLIASSQTICPHLHIPLQSGDDKILKEMNRSYRAGFFEDLIQKLVAKIPGLAVGIDVIVGFPGEGEKEFENTLALLRRISFSYLHVFPYSRRPKTTAAKLPSQIHGGIVKKRSKILRELSRLKREGFYRKFLNKELSVLIEAKRDPETKLLKGFSRNYIPVLIAGEDSLKNNEVAVTMKRVEGKKVFGTLFPNFH
jgi:threonylcarbamoyladenosine tRNA methylthiotransferase MtaB